MQRTEGHVPLCSPQHGCSAGNPLTCSAQQTASATLSTAVPAPSPGRACALDCGLAEGLSFVVNRRPESSEIDPELMSTKKNWNPDHPMLQSETWSQNKQINKQREKRKSQWSVMSAENTQFCLPVFMASHLFIHFFLFWGPRALDKIQCV